MFVSIKKIREELSTTEAVSIFSIIFFFNYTLTYYFYCFFKVCFLTKKNFVLNAIQVFV